MTSFAHSPRHRSLILLLIFLIATVAGTWALHRWTVNIGLSEMSVEEQIGPNWYRVYSDLD